MKATLYLIFCVMGFAHLSYGQESVPDTCKTDSQSVVFNGGKTILPIGAIDSSAGISNVARQVIKDGRQDLTSKIPFIQGEVSASSNYGYPTIFTTESPGKIYYELISDLKLDAPVPIGFKLRYNSLSFNQRNLVYSFYLDREGLNKKYLSKTETVKNELLKDKNSALEEYRQNQQKLSYWENKKNELGTKAKIGGDTLPGVADTLQKINPGGISTVKIPGESGIIDTLAVDSLKPAGIDPALAMDNAKFDSSFIKDIKRPSWKQPATPQSVDDSIAFFSNKSDSLQASLTRIEAGIKSIDSVQAGLKGNFLRKISFVKDFNIGFFSPSYSPFLISRSVIYGVNLVYERNFYFAVTTGKVIKNDYGTFQDENVSGQNSFNQLISPANFSSDTKVSALKLGPGKMEGDHLYFGILTGKNSSGNFSENNGKSGAQKNLVMELDAKYLIHQHVLDFIWGKSTTSYQSSVVASENESSFAKLFKESRNNAFLFSYSGSIKKLRSRILLQTRLSQPYFRSFGVSYMRSDDLKVDFKSDHALSKKLKVSLRLVHEEDNLYGLYLNKFRQQLSSIQVNYKFNRRLTSGLICSPVYYTIERPDSIPVIHSRNFMNSFFINYIPKSKKVFHNVMLLASYNLFESDSERNSMIDISLRESMIFQNTDELNLGLGYVENTTVSVSRNAMLDLGYGFTMMKKAKISPQLTIISNLSDELSYGCSVKFDYAVSSKLKLELSGQKNVPYYDFENRYSVTYQEKPIPYYCYLKLIYNL